MTTLVIAPGKDNKVQDCPYHLLVLETGEHLASHWCSNSSFAPYDLYHSKTDRISKWKERFGEVEIKFINETNVPEGELVRRNQEWFKTQPQPEPKPAA